MKFVIEVQERSSEKVLYAAGVEIEISEEEASKNPARLAAKLIDLEREFMERTFKVVWKAANES